MVMLIIAAIVIGFACSTSDDRREAREAQRKYNGPVIAVTLAALSLVFGPALMDLLFGRP